MAGARAGGSQEVAARPIRPAGRPERIVTSRQPDLSDEEDGIAQRGGGKDGQMPEKHGKFEI